MGTAGNDASGKAYRAPPPPGPAPPPPPPGSPPMLQGPDNCVSPLGDACRMEFHAGQQSYGCRLRRHPRVFWLGGHNHDRLSPTFQPAQSFRGRGARASAKDPLPAARARPSSGDHRRRLGLSAPRLPVPPPAGGPPPAAAAPAESPCRKTGRNFHRDTAKIAVFRRDLDGHHFLGGEGLSRVIVPFALSMADSRPEKGTERPGTTMASA